MARAIQPVESLKADIHSAVGMVDMLIFEVKVLVLGGLLGACEQCVGIVCKRHSQFSLSIYVYI